MNPQGVIFDVDGTLVDSNDAHAHAFVEAFREFGHQVAFSEVRTLIGKGSDKLIAQLIGRYDEAISARKKAIFKAGYLPRLRAFPQAQALLQTLRSRGLRLAVASSAGSDELGALLDVAKVQAYLDEETDADAAEHSKPDPDIIEAALKKLRLPASQCVMVGDTPYDAEAARGAGVAFIGVRCGGWGDEALQPALGVYDGPAALLGQVLRSGSLGR